MRKFIFYIAFLAFLGSGVSLYAIFGKGVSPYTPTLIIILLVIFIVIFIIQRKYLKKDFAKEFERKYSELLQEAKLPVLIHKNGKILFCNKEFFKTFKYDENSNPLDIDLLNFFAENERDRIRDYIEKRCSGKDAPVNYEAYALRGDGIVVKVEVNVSIIELWGEKITLVFIKDLSEKEKFLEELRTSEERYRLIFETSNEGIFLSTKEGKPIIANPALIKMLGYDDINDLLKRDIEKEGYLDPNDRKKFIEIMEREGKVENFETIWLKKDGTFINVIENAHPIRDKNGKIVAFEGTVIDITERKKMEEALKESEKYYKSLFENAHDAIMVFEIENEIILDANETCLKMYGFSREEMIGMSLEKISENVQKGKERIKELLEKGRLTNFETIHFKKDGSKMILEINASLITYKGKEVILSINRDITQKKIAERIMMEKNRQFLALLESVQAMESFTNLQESVKNILKSIVSSFNLKMAWVGLVVPESTELKVIASEGYDEGYTEKIKVRWDESELAKGPVGRCIINRKTTIMRVDDPNFLPWRDEALRRGYKLICGIPLITGDEVRGAIGLYSENEEAFTPYEVETLEIFAGHLTMAIVTASLYEEANRTIQELIELMEEKEKLYKEIEEKQKLLQKVEKGS